MIAQLRSREMQGKRTKCNVNERKARGGREVECERAKWKAKVRFQANCNLGTQCLRMIKQRAKQCSQKFVSQTLFPECIQDFLGDLAEFGVRHKDSTA